MGFARIRKPEGLVSHEVQSKKHDLKVQFICVIQIGVTHKCDQQARLTSVIKRCNSQVQSTGATLKSNQQVRLTSEIN